MIPNGSDLNDYTTPGHYYTPNAAASQTIQNTPYTGSGFKLIVEKLSSNSHVLQTLKGVNSKFVYYRAASDSDFRDWLTPVTNADLDGRLAFLSGGETALEAGSGNTRYRLKIDTVGNVLIFKSTDGGSTWPTSKVIASM